MTEENEHIFRRAAENYPLKTDTPDFGAVLKKMESGSDSSEGNAVPAKKKKRWLLLLLLLLPFAIIELKYAGISGLFNKNEQARPVVSSTKQPGETSVVIKESANKENASTAVAINKTPLSTGNSNEVNANPVDQSIAKLKNNANISPSSDADNDASLKRETAGTQRNIPVHPAVQKEKRPNDPIIGSDENRNRPHQKISYAEKQKQQVSITNEQATGDDISEKLVAAVKKTTTATVTNPEEPTGSANNNDIIAKNEVITTKEDAAEKKPVAEPAKTALKDQEATKSPDKHEKKNKSKQKHFYAGLIGGPDYSTIKLQAVKKTGINFGFVVGYKINNRLSIETGLLKDKKFYSSKGQYFSTEKIWMPAYANIEYVSGDCKMLELPVNLYYYFGKKSQRNWFASAGISSYFMNKETYTFDVKRYGQTYPYTADYKTHDNQFAAVINFSAGYTHRLGKICDLRIEPYIKLPVSKVGTGDLPIQSAGMMIGLTRTLF